MASPATINSLALSVRRRMNLVNLITMPDAELKEYIRDALAAFHEVMVSRWRDYFVSKTTYTLTANVEAYLLPENFRAVAAVYAVSLQNGPIPVRQQLSQFNMNQFGASYPSNVINTSVLPTMYRVMGDNIYFTPVPQASTANGIELWYIQQFTQPQTDDTTISQVICSGWELWCIYETCISVAARMNLTEFYQMYKAMQDKAEQRIVAGLSIRDETANVMVNQFDGNGGPLFGGY